MEISDFTRDLTAEARSGLLERPIGRDRELKVIVGVLGSSDKSNALIIGPAGSGKTMLAEGLACMITEGDVPAEYPRSKVIELNTTALNSGAMYVGQFEERVTQFLEFVKSDPRIVVFIDEIHMLMGFGRAGDSGASRDFSQIIKPALARGQICAIGATTTEEYQRYIEPDAAFARRFQLVELRPLLQDAVLQILRRAGVKVKYRHGLEFTDTTLSAIFQLSEELYPNRSQPDKALDVLKRVTGQLRRSEATFPHPNTNSISAYVDLLADELYALKNQNFNKVQAFARKWLGLQQERAATVEKSKEELAQIVSVQ